MPQDKIFSDGDNNFKSSFSITYLNAKKNSDLSEKK